MSEARFFRGVSTGGSYTQSGLPWGARLNAVASPPLVPRLRRRVCPRVNTGRAAPRGAAAARRAAVRCDGSPRGEWWNQEAAVKALLNYLDQTPTEGLLLTGPLSSGKSRMLVEVVAQLKQRSPPPAVFYIDCRAGDFSSADAFARELQLQAVLLSRPLALRWLAPLLDAALSIIDVKAGVPPVSINFSFALRTLLKGALPMEDVLSIYSRAIADACAVPGAPPPVLIVDEANRLRQWSDAPKRLTNLLSFLARVSKQENSAHVVLATSDGAFGSWLGTRKGINTLFFSTLYLADVSEEEARAYFFDHSLRQKPAAAAVLRACPEAWPAIFKVCGGNVGTLQRVAMRVRDNDPSGWKQAARDILSNAKTKVMGGLALSADGGGNGASAAHYALAAVELLCADGHAVPLERMHDVIGAAAANALVQDDLLAFQDAAPLGSRVEGRLFDGGAVVKCFRPVSAGEVVVWHELEPRLREAASRLRPLPGQAGGSQGSGV